MMIGRKRMMPALASASLSGSPRFLSRLAKSTSRMPFFVTRPISMMKPISENMLIVLPATKSPTRTPTRDSGSDAMMASGCRKLPNCEASTM
ncbi:hypothetical protein D3C71_2065050 [compost metagenome]